MGAAVVGPQKGVSVCVPASEPAGGRPRDVGSWERRCQVASPPAESWGCTSSSGRPDMIATGRVGRAPPVSAGSDLAAGAEWGRSQGAGTGGPGLTRCWPALRMSAIPDLRPGLSLGGRSSQQPALQTPADVWRAQESAGERRRGASWGPVARSPQNWAAG